MAKSRFDEQRWLRLYTNDRTVVKEFVRGALISTIKLPHGNELFDLTNAFAQLGSNPYETMVFPNYTGGGMGKGSWSHQEQYDTIEEARKGHLRIVEEVKNGLHLGEDDGKD